MRHFENTRVAQLSASEYERQANILWPLQQKHMARLLLSGIMKPLIANGERLEQQTTDPPINEGTRLYPVQNTWRSISSSHRAALRGAFASQPALNDRLLFVYREDTMHSSQAVRVSRDYLYEAGYVSVVASGETMPDVTASQLEILRGCCKELQQARQAHDLTMIDRRTLEEAWSITDPPQNWLPINWR